MQRTGWFLSVIAVVGCSSTPVHYYTLTPSPPVLATRVAEGVPGIDISLPRIPAQVNRSELLVRRGNEELVLLENEQWASALSDEIRNALRIALLDDLAKSETTTVRGFSKLSIVLDIARFDSMPNQFDTIDATWRLSVGAAGLPPKVVTCPFSSRVTIAPGNAAIVAGYQRLVVWLADDIVSVLQAGAGAAGLVCPGSRSSH